ncbi:hypothetical protein BU16DRAFT_525370 [Lophium mytilinum]|uniref:Ubiquitin-like domain-containing protein n=1 Tax=Lophium mytilinum TaxID=390894 RepID=A0A6A6R1G1_9PEZI|nr:hypothetical protein BU16DRAFT_525370 [Lophium mytilinum]
MLTTLKGYWGWEARRGNRLTSPISQLILQYLTLTLSRGSHSSTLDIPTSAPETLRVEEVRAQAARMLDVRNPVANIIDPSQLRLYHRGEELNDDTMSAIDAGMGFEVLEEPIELWYTIDEPDFGGQMLDEEFGEPMLDEQNSGEQILDEVEILRRQITAMQERLASLEARGKGYILHSLPKPPHPQLTTAPPAKHQHPPYCAHA